MFGNFQNSFAKIFGTRPSVPESRSQALHAQRSWVEGVAARRESNLEHCQTLARELPAQRGFTLIELMISVAIVGLLIAIALPAYANFTTRSQASEGIRFADAIETAVTDSFVSTGVMPGTLAAAGLVSQQGKYVASTAVNAGGIISITYGNEAPAPLTGTVVTMSPYLTTDGITVSWICGYSGASLPAGWTLAPLDGTGTAAPVSTTPAQYLPKACRAGG